MADTDPATLNAPLRRIHPADATSHVLLEAVIAMSSDLDLHSVLTRIVRTAAEITGARHGTLGATGAEGVLDDVVTFGLDREQQPRIEEHDSDGPLTRPTPSPDPEERLEASSPTESSLEVPVRIRGALWGTLVLAEKEGGFTEEDVTLVETLATAAGVGMERAQAISDRADLAVLSDRERIARDLHDVVIQRLFATGLSLQGTALTAPVVGEEIRRAVTALDQTIRDIRGTIFELQHRGGSSLRAELRELLREYVGVLGFHPTVKVSGPIDTAIPGAIREHLVAVLREALSNVSRHAGAHAVDIDLAVTTDRVGLQVLDDGVGLSGETPHSGLRNLRRRATQLGGSFILRGRPEGGTELLWEAPLRPADS